MQIEWTPAERRALIRAQEEIAANTAGINKKLDALLGIIGLFAEALQEEIKHRSES